MHPSDDPTNDNTEDYCRAIEGVDYDVHQHALGLLDVSTGTWVGGDEPYCVTIPLQTAECPPGSEDQVTLIRLYSRHWAGGPRHGCGTPAGYAGCNDDMYDGAADLALELQAEGWEIDAAELKRLWRVDEAAGGNGWGGHADAILAAFYPALGQ